MVYHFRLNIYLASLKVRQYRRSDFFNLMNLFEVENWISIISIKFRCLMSFRLIIEELIVNKDILAKILRQFFGFLNLNSERDCFTHYLIDFRIYKAYINLQVRLVRNLHLVPLFLSHQSGNI